jgi:hypothetical protein
MIKKILAVVIASTALMAVPAQAQHWHNGHYRGPVYHGHAHGGGWVAPLIIGGVVGAAIANSNRETVVVQEQPVIIRQQQPVYVQTPQTVCTAWKEIQNSDGTIYRERTCYQQ